MKEYNFLAFGIGAISGQIVFGTLKDAKFGMKEIHRFPDPMVELHRRFYQDIYYLYTFLVESLAIYARQRIRLYSIRIDAWEVDFRYVVLDGSLLDLPRTYRDPYIDDTLRGFLKRIPREEVYKRTDIQMMSFSSLLRLFRAGQGSFIPQEMTERILFIPDPLVYILTERMVCEHTIASTSQLLNPGTHKFDYKLLETVGISPTLICPVVTPGTLIGWLGESIARKTRIGEVSVVAVAGHDTASTIAAVPTSPPNFAYLDGGAWSLMGIEVEKSIISKISFRSNFTSEGGIEGTACLLRNITGMWILERCRERWKRSGSDYSYNDMVWMAESSELTSLINPDDPRFVNPESMLHETTTYCEETGQVAPTSGVNYIHCIFYSLASRYREVPEILKSILPHPIGRLYMTNGGSRNGLPDQLTTSTINVSTLVGPSEATAIGNCLVQVRSAELLMGCQGVRGLIATVLLPKKFYPER